MINNEQNVINKFDFKMDKVERYVSFGALALFILSFNDKNGIWTFLLFAITALIFVYYFIWYRKKPFYMLIEDENIVIYPPLFFKRHDIKKQEIDYVKVFEKKIEVGYSMKDADKTINIYSLILKDEDWKQLKTIFEQMEQA